MKIKITSVILTVLMLFVSVPYVFAENTEAQAEPSAAGQYLGDGMVIAVLDNGFDTDHYLLKFSESHSVKLSKSDISKKLQVTSIYSQAKNIVSRTYISEKIPFAFDYTDNWLNVNSPYSNGTETAGIIGAYTRSGESGITGIAPSAQLLLMKISRGETDNNTADGEIAARAISDAVILGADAIFINIDGQDHLAYDEHFINAIDKARDAGVPVFAGAGTGGLIGADSIYDTVYGIQAPVTSIADYGTQSGFSKIKSLITVAASDSAMSNVFSFILGGLDNNTSDEDTSDESIIQYSDTNVAYRTADGKNFAQYFSGSELSYVTIPGVGKKDDFAQFEAENGKGSINGKIALIARGEIPFTDKINNASEYRAAGVIVYEVDPEESSGVLMSIEGAMLPAVFISYDDGQKLLNAEKRIISIPEPEEELTELASFTSAGATDILTIGPDFITEGNFVQTATNDDGINTVAGGTQYSAAKAAGIYTCVKAAMIEKGYRADSDKALCELVLKLISSSASVVADEDGMELSPKIQGSGMADVYSAIESGAVIYDTNTKESKTELGENKKLLQRLDKGGDFATLYVTVENVTDHKVSYDLSVSVLTDKAVTFSREDIFASGDTMYDITGWSSDVLFGFDPDEPLPYFVTGYSEEISGASVTSGDFDLYLNRASDKFKPKTITLSAGQKVELEIRISLSSDALKKYSELFENGFFVEGYVYLTPADGAGSVISHPYMGFCGDWSKSPIVSEKLYDSPASYYGDNILAANINSDYYYGAVMLGQNYLVSVDSDAGRNDEALNAISPYLTYDEGTLGYPSGLCWSVTPLRDITSHNVVIREKDSEKIIYQQNLGAISRGAVNKAGYVSSHIEKLWSCSADDNPAYLYPDGRYVCEITVYTDLDSDKFEFETISQVISFEFSIDTGVPEMTDFNVVEIDGNKYFEITAKDENYVQAIYCNDGYVDFVCDDSALKPAAIVENGIGNKVTLRFDATDFFAIEQSEFGDTGSPYVYVEVVDYAHNSTVYRITRDEIMQMIP